MSFAGTCVVTAPIPNVAPLAKESVLVFILKVVELAFATELRPSLASGTGVTVVASEMLLGGGGDGVGDGVGDAVACEMLLLVVAGRGDTEVDGGGGGGTLEAVTVVTVTAGSGGSVEEVVAKEEIDTTTMVGENIELELSLTTIVLALVPALDAVAAVSVLDVNAVTVAVCICVSDTVMVVNEASSQELCDCPAAALSASLNSP